MVDSSRRYILLFLSLSSLLSNVCIVVRERAHPGPPHALNAGMLPAAGAGWDAHPPAVCPHWGLPPALSLALLMHTRVLNQGLLHWSRRVLYPGQGFGVLPALPCSTGPTRGSVCVASASPLMLLLKHQCMDQSLITAPGKAFGMLPGWCFPAKSFPFLSGAVFQPGVLRDGTGIFTPSYTSL